MDEETYTFDNGWTMKREAVSPHFWIVRNANGEQIDRDRYRYDVFDRYELRINGHRP
jgi:hypothetical protein